LVYFDHIYLGGIDMAIRFIRVQSEPDLPEGWFLRAPFMTPRDVANAQNVKESTVRSWVHRGRGPRAFKVGSVIRFSPAEYLAWLEEGGP